jgi:hypothetical protein
MSRNCTFRDSSQQIVNIVPYRSQNYDNLYFIWSQIFQFRETFRQIMTSEGYINLHFNCVETFEVSWLVPTIRDYSIVKLQCNVTFITVLSWNSKFRYSFRTVGIIVLYRSHGYNILHFISVQIFDYSWYVPTNQLYYSVQITRLKKASFLLCPDIWHFMILSDVSGILHCTNHTAQTIFISVVSKYTTFRETIWRIGINVLYVSHGNINLHFSCALKFGISKFVPTNRGYFIYGSHGYNNLHFSCVQKFDLSCFVLANRNYCTVQITRLQKPSFHFCPKIRTFVIRCNESGLLYCGDRNAMTIFIQLYLEIRNFLTRFDESRLL